MILLPPVKITQGEPFTSSFTVTGQSWTGYTGTVSYKTKPGGETIFDDTVTGNAMGEVTFSLTAAETLLFPALPVIGYRVTAVGQITMASAGDTQVFQFNVAVAGAI